MNLEKIRLCVKNRGEVETELERISDAIHRLLDTGILRMPQDIEPKNLLDRVSGYITKSLQVEVRDCDR